MLPFQAANHPLKWVSLESRDLDQHRTAINYNNLPGTEALLHQVQIGKRDITCLANPANRQTLSYALVQLFAILFAHISAQAGPDYSRRNGIHADGCQLYRKSACKRIYCPANTCSKGQPLQRSQTRNAGRQDD
jgi:hypothetical protein